MPILALLPTLFDYEKPRICLAIDILSSKKECFLSLPLGMYLFSVVIGKIPIPSKETVFSIAIARSVPVARPPCRNIGVYEKIYFES